MIFVLAAVWALGWHFMLPEDFQELGKQIFAAAAFGSNLLTYSQVGYFDAPAITKPLLHLRSLGVEEQFYLLTPLALMAAVRWRYSMPWILAVGAVVSFAINIVLVRYDQAAAFYLPFTRFWELLVGGGLAYAAIHFPERLRRLQHWVVSLLGLLLIGVAAFATPFALFPGWWAIPPVLGAALVIAAGPSAGSNRILASPPAVGIGLISYPLYLWHWPLLVFMREELEIQHGAFLLLATTSLVLATITYLFIERPVRTFRLRPVATASLATMLLVAAAGFEVMRTNGLPSRYHPPLPSILLPTPIPQYAGPDLEAGNIAGPKVLLWGDSHAGHLIPGFVALRRTRPLSIYGESFSDCPPTRAHAESARQHCAEKSRPSNNDWCR